MKTTENRSNSLSPIRASIQAARQIHDLLFQFRLLLGRNFIVKWSDKVSLVLLFLQALVIALLLAATFYHFERDHRQIDRFARLWHCFTQKYTQSEQTVIMEALFRKCKNQSEAEKSDINGISEPFAQKRASILFMLGASAIWLGIVNAAREIVSEKTILLRETRGSLSLSSYLGAKAVMLYIIAFSQTGLLLAVTSYFMSIICPSQTQFYLFWAILFGTSIAATNLGLLISSLVSTEQAALTIVPIVVIPQLFLGGLVRSAKYYSSALDWGSHLILQKWSFKSLLWSDSLSGVTMLEPNIDLGLRDPIMNFSYQKSNLLDYFFGASSKISFVLHGVDFLSFLMLAIHIIAPLLLAYVVLKNKY